MDGESPRGTTKVGLVSPTALWAFMLDPYKGELPHAFSVGTDEKGLAYQLGKMLEFLVPYLEESAEHRNGIDDRRRSLRKDFLQFNSQQGSWKDVFEKPNIFQTMSIEELQADQKKLTLEMVSDWIKKTGGHCSRLSFFSILPQSQFYSVLAEPLLSLRTTGSITVERIAKPMKHKVLEKHRNRLGIVKAELLLRVGLNLRALMARSKVLKSNVVVVLDVGGDIFED
jgi:hypothetical protein